VVGVRRRSAAHLASGWGGGTAALCGLPPHLRASNLPLLLLLPLLQGAAARLQLLQVRRLQEGGLLHSPPCQKQHWKVREPSLCQL
jgi:hypothetical protein